MNRWKLEGVESLCKEFVDRNEAIFIIPKSCLLFLNMKTTHSRLFFIYNERHVKIISAPHILLSVHAPVRQQPTAPCIYLFLAHTSFVLGAGSIFHPDGSAPQFFDTHDSAHSRNIDHIHSTCAAAAPSPMQKSLLLTLRRKGTAWYQKCCIGGGKNNLPEKSEFYIYIYYYCSYLG